MNSNWIKHQEKVVYQTIKRLAYIAVGAVMTYAEKEYDVGESQDRTRRNQSYRFLANQKWPTWSNRTARGSLIQWKYTYILELWPHTTPVTVRAVIYLLSDFDALIPLVWNGVPTLTHCPINTEQ
jgi:hypothetical protein